jgi:threonine synthase
MKYISTRGGVARATFEEVVMEGMARDNGLFLPEEFLDVRHFFSEWKKITYEELALAIMRLFVDIPPAVLKKIIKNSLVHFTHPDICPVRKVGELFILELFYGPTLAFKDIALQFLARLFEYFLEKNETIMNIVVATSGDTGGAAVEAMRGIRGIRLFVLYPYGRISPDQERQMTTASEENINCIAIEGSFDDCQAIVKNLFADMEFRDRFKLGAVNSINFARLLAQAVYYFYAGFKAMRLLNKNSCIFSVPTGNFGDIFAGYMAKMMGLPVEKLVLATNENDILDKFFKTGVYEKGQVHQTMSPSMDIQIASNFERYLFLKMEKNGAKVAELMRRFAEAGSIKIDIPQNSVVDDCIVSEKCTENECLEMMAYFYKKYGYVLDPHTAVGVKGAMKYQNSEFPVIALATAHPAKFRDAVRKALGDGAVVTHPILENLRFKTQRRVVLPAELDVVRNLIKERAGGRT